MNDKVSLILASGSRSRAEMLTNAGLTFVTEVARVDESSVKDSLGAAGAKAADVAETLAQMKAERVSNKHPGALVIGADQMLECNGTWFDKPEDQASARQQLLALRGCEHRLLSSVVVALGGRRIWHHHDTARLTMREFSDGFLTSYLDNIGDDVITTVGGYRLEGEGIQLFERITGDFFTILGMPLLPLLAFLREHGVVGR